MSPYLLAVCVLLPVLGGMLMIPLKIQSDRIRAVYAECVTCATSVLVWLAILFGARTPVDLYSFTNGFSITFRVDGMASLFSGMISVMWPLVLLYAFEYMEHANRKNVFFAFYVMTYGITLGVAFSGDMITMYVFFEMLTLVTIPLVAHYNDHESLYAGRIYAAYTIGGASLAFFAVVLTTIYGNTGSFVCGGSIDTSYNGTIFQVAYLLAFFGFGAKAAVFPLFDWLPKASAAPTPVTALLHAVAVVNSGVFAVARMTYYVFGADYLAGTAVQRICLLTAIFSLVFGAAMALKERHFKRRLAYSTMSNLSYMLFGILLVTPEGFVGGMAHMLCHGIIKMSLFLCAGAFMHQTGKSYVYEINGVGKRMPVTFACYTLGALSLTGIPPFCGFVSKWQLLTAGAASATVSGYIGCAALIIAAFLCAVYTLTVSLRAFFPMKGTDRFSAPDSAHEAGWRILTPIVFFTIINIALGLFSGPVLNFLRLIAAGKL